MTLLLAGHETTANALVLDVLPALAEPGGRSAGCTPRSTRCWAAALPGLDDVPRLRYAEQVFAESMRLYPPAWGIGRQAVVGLSASAATRCPRARWSSMSPWVTHHDQRWFPDPFRFDPERFLPEARAPRAPKFSYFPFGGGARQCIGEQFAWMEGVLLLATLAQRFRFRLASGRRRRAAGAHHAAPARRVAHDRGEERTGRRAGRIGGRRGECLDAAAGRPRELRFQHLFPD